MMMPIIDEDSNSMDSSKHNYMMSGHSNGGGGPNATATGGLTKAEIRKVSRMITNGIVVFLGLPSPLAEGPSVRSSTPPPPSHLYPRLLCIVPPWECDLEYKFPPGRGRRRDT